MKAHSKCLSKWFESGCKPAPVSIPGTVEEATTKSNCSGSCPNCRASLDWDQLVIESRNKCVHAPGAPPDPTFSPDSVAPLGARAGLASPAERVYSGPARRRMPLSQLLANPSTLRSS